MFDLVEALRKDWKRHRMSASTRSMPALATYRFGRWARQQPLPVRWVGGKMYGVGLMVSELVSGIFLDRNTDVGDDLHFIHAGGINIHPDTKIGNRVGIMQGVTLGTGPDDAAPTIGDDVFIGPNASVIGGVKVGNGARIAANTLVIRDVPAGALAIGVPAKIIPQLKTALDRDDDATKPAAVG